MKENQKDIILSPEIVAKQERVKELKVKFLELYSVLNDMTHIEREDLNIKYLRAVGRFMYENFRLSVQVRALKMKVELAQSYINRDETPDINSIEEIVNEQLKEYFKIIEQQTREIKELENTMSISNDEMEELKDLYRILVKATHPDLHPDQDETMRDLFILGQQAYNSLNLPKLREIVFRLRIGDYNSDLSSIEETLDESIARLEEKISEQQEKIDRLNQQFPFTEREHLNDKEWIKNRQKELKEEKKVLLEQKKIYEDRLELLLSI